MLLALAKLEDPSVGNSCAGVEFLFSGTLGETPRLLPLNKWDFQNFCCWVEKSSVFGLGMF